MIFKVFNIKMHGEDITEVFSLLRAVYKIHTVYIFKKFKKENIKWQ